MAGLQADNQGGVVIGIELGPIHGDDDLGALSHDIGNPVIEQVPDIEFGIGEQAVDLFDGVLSLKAVGEGEAIADGMNSQLPRADNAESGIGQRQGALGVHVLAKYVVDMVEDHFVVEHGVCRLVLAGQCWRSYLRSRVTFGLYGGMIKR